MNRGTPMSNSEARKKAGEEAAKHHRSLELSDLLHELFPCGDVSDLDIPPCWTGAQIVLASDWLAADRARVRAEERERIASSIEAERSPFNDPEENDAYEYAAQIARRSS